MRKNVAQVPPDVVQISSPAIPNLNPPPPARKVPLDDPIEPRDQANVLQNPGPTPPMYGPPAGSDPQVVSPPPKADPHVVKPPAPDPA